ncbi:MAG: hypothetical protein ACE5G9_10405, partial [Nitrospinales bacterium]
MGQALSDQGMYLKFFKTPIYWVASILLVFLLLEIVVRTFMPQKIDPILYQVAEKLMIFRNSYPAD